MLEKLENFVKEDFLMLSHQGKCLVKRSTAYI